jgi:YHS domain-containing protein
VRFLIWVLLIYLVYRMVRGKAAARLTKEPAGTETFQDPVCGVWISEADAVVGRLEGERYHFCSMQCLQQFERCSSKGNKKPNAEE